MDSTIAARFTDEDIARLQGAVGVLSTLGPDGSVHSVPVQVGVEVNELVCGTAENSQKVANVRRIAKATFCVYGQPKWYISVRGDATVEPDGQGRAVIRITPHRIDRRDAA